jgi:hypothetical protein
MPEFIKFESMNFVLFAHFQIFTVAYAVNKKQKNHLKITGKADECGLLKAIAKYNRRAATHIIRINNAIIKPRMSLLYWLPFFRSVMLTRIMATHPKRIEQDPSIEIYIPLNIFYNSFPQTDL